MRWAAAKTSRRPDTISRIAQSARPAAATCQWARALYDQEHGVWGPKRHAPLSTQKKQGNNLRRRLEECVNERARRLRISPHDARARDTHFLLDRGADTALRDATGKTALDYAREPAPISPAGTQADDTNGGRYATSNRAATVAILESAVAEAGGN